MATSSAGYRREDIDLIAIDRKLSLVCITVTSESAQKTLDFPRRSTKRLSTFCPVGLAGGHQKQPHLSERSCYRRQRRRGGSGVRRKLAVMKTARCSAASSDHVP